jgi:hypothetical protein
MLPAGPASPAARVAWDVSEQGQALLAVLFPHLAGLRVHRVEDAGAAVMIAASCRAESACCPRCGLESARVHGGYARTVADGAAGVYRFRTRHRYCDLRLGRMNRLRQDRGLCPSACSTCS